MRDRDDYEIVARYKAAGWLVGSALFNSMMDFGMSNSSWACPFCALHCDDLVAPKLNNKKVLNANKCLKASEAFPDLTLKAKKINLVTYMTKRLFKIL